MVLHIILANILLIARIFPRPFGARKNTTQLAKYPRVLYVKPSNKIYVFHSVIVEQVEASECILLETGIVFLFVQVFSLKKSNSML